MKFTVEAIRTAGGWDVIVHDPGTMLAALAPPGQVPVSAQGNFPLPPAAEDLSSITDAFPQLDGAALQTALSKIVDGTPGKKPVPFGRYLFLTLLGPDLWKKIDRAAGDQPIELVLAWDSAQTALHRLPWEMMHGEKTFLAEDPQIAVARQITDATTPLAGASFAAKRADRHRHRFVE